MRLALFVLFVAAGTVYTGAAWHSYREEVSARADGANPPLEGFRHPEANLRILRNAIAANEYTDRLLPHLERSLEEAPSFYQPPLLMAAFYANRLERPDLTRRSFEAALARFPSNGRLHLTYAEWLLAPRASLPYRVYRGEGGPESRSLALERLETATTLEPDLTRQALDLMLRFQVPVAEWAERLPRTETTKSLMLDTVDHEIAHARHGRPYPGRSKHPGETSLGVPGHGVDHRASETDRYLRREMGGAGSRPRGGREMA